MTSYVQDGAMKSFHAEKFCRLVSSHAASARHSAYQYLLCSAFVLLVVPRIHSYGQVGVLNPKPALQVITASPHYFIVAPVGAPPSLHILFCVASRCVHAGVTVVSSSCEVWPLFNVMHRRTIGLQGRLHSSAKRRQ